MDQNIELLEILIPLVEKAENPIANLLLIALVSVLIIIPSVFGAYKIYATFNFEFIKKRNLKLFDKALDSTDLSPSEKDLIEECRNQELFLLTTGIYASKPEREQIRNWTTNYAIPIFFIKKAWPQIKVNDNKISAKPSTLDNILFWYLLISFASFWFAGSLLFFYLLSRFSELQSLKAFWAPLLILLASLLVLMPIMPISYLRRIEHRLETPNKLTNQKNTPVQN